MTDEKFQEEQQRILEEWSMRNDGFTGAFYLLYDADSVKGATKVVGESEFEKEFRTRMDENQNPDAILVILPV